jgi:hypothetical protein
MKNTLRFIGLSLLPVCLAGCLYTNIHTPWAYRAATPSDLKTATGDAMVSGKACDRVVLYLVAWGDSGYRAAVADALAGRPDGILYDVKTDIHVNSYVLGLYTHTCTEVSGKVGRL